MPKPFRSDLIHEVQPRFLCLGFARAGLPVSSLLWCAVLTCLAALSGLAAAPATHLTFERDIRPILKANCFDCHGEMDPPKGELDLRLRRWLVKGGKTGPAIIPGRPAESLLVKLVRAGEMPKREKKLTPDETARLEQWIAAGAPTLREEPNELPRGMVITEEERSHWAYQPIRRPEIPASRPNDRVRTPVDALLLASLKAKDRRLGFSPDADRITLLRRLHFDLLGLPPTPEETERFLADEEPLAYERAVDRLLEREEYGERWARHWLDVAGYADSDGASADDTPREFAYKYRDYVIRSLNRDKPFDAFVIEQLAGDELVKPPYRNLSGEDLEKLVATGFLRMGPDGTASAADPDVAKNQVMADTVKIVTSSLLGLTVGCAQCHDHRYDPIPQTDYYRLRAVFEPAYDWKKWLTPAQRLISLYTDADRAQAAAVESEAQKAASEHAAKQKQFIEAALEKELGKFPEGMRPKLREAYQTPGDKRSPEQQKLLAENPSVNISAGTLYQYDAKAAEELKTLDARIGEIRARKPPEDFISVLTEPAAAPVPVTYRFHRGDHHQPQEPIKPGGLAVLEADGRRVDFPEKEPGRESSGRRLAFARWVASTNNPLFARVIANRVWLHHFGRGLVRTPADFGAMGEKPTHPELLDWLALSFAEQGWSLKQLHRLILTSTAYRQSSLRSEGPGAGETRELDPDGSLYSRRTVQRLDAEAVRDSILAASGNLNPKKFGPPVPVRADVTGQVVVGVDRTSGDNKMPVDVPLNGEEYRRSVYVQVRRSKPLAFLNTFDAPVMELNCEKRPTSTVAPQALMLMNSQFVLDQAERFATRLRREAGVSRERQVKRAWQLTFSRDPKPGELTRSLEFLTRQETAVAELQVQTKEPGKILPETQALRSFCQTLLSANEFLYVD